MKATKAEGRDVVCLPTALAALGCGSAKIIPKGEAENEGGPPTIDSPDAPFAFSVVNFPMSITVAAFSGSLRKESYTTKLVKAFQQLAPEGVEVQIVDIGQLPLINQDLERNLPQPVKDLHASIEGADAILLATPEYNRSYSPILKNALDWGSRPEGQNKWKQKPTAVVGCTPYALGAFGAQHHLRQVLVYLDMYALQQPEFYLGQAAEKFNQQGKLADEVTRKKIVELWSAFVPWIKKLK